MFHVEGDQSTAETKSQFAQAVRASVSSGELSGAVVAVGTKRTLWVEAYGLRDQASKSPMEVDTIFRVGSMAKTVFTAGALVLLEDKKFGLDDAIAKWLPELGNRRVLRTPSSEVDDTVPARREITMFDVLSFQLGIGMYLGQQDTPLFRAMLALGVAPVTELVPFGPDEFASRLGSLPLAHHPGDTFMYHTSDDVLRILIRRISGQPLGEFLQERVFQPLSMVDSGTSVPTSKHHRVSTCYFARANAGDSLTVWDEPDNRFAKDPIFPNSLVSTAGDYINFSRMLLDGGMFQGRRFLSSESVALMMTDHLSDEQKQRSPGGPFWQTRGWGMGGSVYTRSIPQGPNAGSYSWFGGYGGHFIFDPKRGSAIISMIPRMALSANDTALGYAFELNTYRDVLCSEED